MSAPLSFAEADVPALLGQLVDAVATAIESQLNMRAYIKARGGEYELSLTLNYEKKLHEAAVAAIQTVVAFEPLAPPSTPIT